MSKGSNYNILNIAAGGCANTINVDETLKEIVTKYSRAGDAQRGDKGIFDIKKIYLLQYYH